MKNKRKKELYFSKYFCSNDSHGLGRISPEHYSRGIISDQNDKIRRVKRNVFRIDSKETKQTETFF